MSKKTMISTYGHSTKLRTPVV